MDAKVPKEKPSVGLASILSGLLCTAHAYFLYNRYSLAMSTPAIDPAELLYDPIIHYAEIRLGLYFPQFPITLPLLYLASIYFLTWFVRGTGKTFSMAEPMAVYNLYATLLSAVMFVLFFQRFWVRGQEELERGGNPVLYFLKPGDKDFNLWLGAMILNYHSKYIEYADTVFMILKGNFNQVNDLHVIHHFEMGPIMYIVTLIGFGGSMSLGPMINSFVHFLMYRECHPPTHAQILPLHAPLTLPSL